LTYQSKPVPADELYSSFSSIQDGAAGLEVCVGPTGSGKLGGSAVLLQCCVCDAILSCMRAREGQLTAADVAPAREAAEAFLLCDHQFLGLSQSVIPKSNESSLNAQYQLL
jgi:hypothetical protein